MVPRRSGRGRLIVLRALARRFVTACATLLLVTLLVFALVHLAPGDATSADEDMPFDAARLNPQALAELRALYRLDEPLHRQYLLWLGDVLRGDLGQSSWYRRPVAAKIGERLGVSLALNTLALAAMLALAMPIGCAAALRPGSAWDRLSATGTYALYAMPVFWAALLLQLVLADRLGWLPLSGLRSPAFDDLGAPRRWLDLAAHLVLPVVCLTYGGLAYLSRFVRAVLLDGAVAETWRAARARGLSETAVVLRHGLRQAGVPLLTLAGFLLPGLVGGSVIVETIFGIPGLGGLFYDAAIRRDLPLLMGLTLLSSVATLAGVLIADVAYVVVDPRVRRA